ncbi:MAG TPA: hypothetical protein VLG38_00265, partial [Gammaproteobacteria bacterium]|nr:hypothetical protein [Gammaproteobacteria bacterium]
PTTSSSSSSPYPAAIVYGFTASTTTSTPQKQDLVVPKDLLNLVVRGDEHLLDDLFPPDLFPPDLVPKTQPQASTNFSDELKPEDYMNLNLSDYEDDDDEEVDEFTEAMFPGPQDNLLEPDNSQMEIVRHGVKQARKKPIITQQNNQGGSGTGPGNKKSKRG